MFTPFRIAALALGLSVAQPAGALPPLHENSTVLSGFYAIGLADEVRKNCPRIAPRLIRAWSFLQSLESFARDAGYSNEQIDALQDNRAAKDELRARILADLAARGATPDNPEGYCRVGEEEIAKDSAAGRLLRVK